MIQESYFMKYFTPLTGVLSCLLLCEGLSSIGTLRGVCNRKLLRRCLSPTKKRFQGLDILIEFVIKVALPVHINKGASQNNRDKKGMSYQ